MLKPVAAVAAAAPGGSVLQELERFESFSQVSPASRALMAQGVIRRNVPSASAVLHKGQPVSGPYVVLHGQLRVFTISSSGTEATLYFVGPGETCVLALNCLFNDLLYPAWVQAETPTAVALIPGPIYRRLFEAEPAIQNLTVSTLSSLVYRLMAELEKMHSSNHRERLAQFILTHAGADGLLHMTQQQLAHHLGTTREVVARLIGEFAASELVKTRRGVIAIRDLFGLRRIVAPDPGPVGRRRR